MRFWIELVHQLGDHNFFSVTAIQSLAQQALLTATQTGNAMVDQASQSLLNAVTPFQNMLGDAYEELINILSGINSSHFQI